MSQASSLDFSSMELPLSEEDKREILEAQEELTAVKAKARRAVESRDKLKRELLQLEAENAQLRKTVFEHRAGLISLREEEEDEDEIEDLVSTGTSAMHDLESEGIREGQASQPAGDVVGDVAGGEGEGPDSAGLERKSLGGEPSQGDSHHTRTATGASAVSNVSSPGSTRRRKVDKSVLKLALRSQTESLLAAANAHLRDNLFQLLKQRRRLVLDISTLSKEEKGNVSWVMADGVEEERLYKHLGGQPLTSRRPPEELSVDWEAMFPAPRDGAVEAVIGALHANRGPYCRESAAVEPGSGKGTLVACNMGFAVSSPEMDPYPFDQEDSHDNIRLVRPTLAGPQQIKCATLDKLVERVTHETYVDLNTRYVFLLTYHSFTTSRELMQKLARRYDMPIPPNLTPEEIHHFKTTKLDRIQIRVCSVLKNWLDEHYEDFRDDSGLTADLQSLIDHMLATSDNPLPTRMAKALRALIKRRKALGKGRGNVMFKSRFPKPLFDELKTTSDNFSMLDCKSLEIARQLTLMDFEKFRSITPRECLNQGWSKANKHERAPNVCYMIEQFEKISGWVQTEILKHENVNERATVMKKFVTIARHCRELNNFNSLFAIYCALGTNAIHRLKRTKALLPAHAHESLSSWKELFTGTKNSKNLRKALQSSLTPLIPHLGLFLQDLTFIEDGNNDFEDGMINFQKRCKLAERIRWIKQYQQEGYQLQPVPVIQDYLRRSLHIVDEEAMWSLSLKVEPREPKPQ